MNDTIPHNRMKGVFSIPQPFFGLFFHVLDKDTGCPIQFDFDSIEFGHAFFPADPIQPGDVHINKGYHQDWKARDALVEVLP